MSKFLSKLPIVIKENIIHPLYLSSDDLPWLIHLLNAFSRFEGLPIQKWEQFIKEGFNFKMPYHKGRFALETLEKELTLIQKIPFDLIKAQINIFTLATQKRIEEKAKSQYTKIDSTEDFKNKIYEETQVIFTNFNKKQVEQSIEFGLSSLKTLNSISILGDRYELPRKLNGHLIKKIMAHAFVIEIILTDQCRRIIRQAKWKGLICEIFQKSPGYLLLRISGPLAIFGATSIYGRQLQEFIPLLFWNLDFKLRATFRSKGESYRLLIDSTAPLKISPLPQMFDSKIEEQFYADFGKATFHWNLNREPLPLVVGEKMLFPDFQAIKKGDSSQSVFIEIIGFWTETYLRKKVQEIQLVKNYKFLFLINEKFKTLIENDLKTIAPNHRILYFKRKISIKETLSCLNSLVDLNNEGTPQSELKPS